ncbi:hypothetical protein GCM10008929_22380 [Alkalibacterium psychrotolerans]
MSKRTRKIVGLLMGLLMILSVVAPATAMAEAERPDTRPETGNLHIHKLVFNDGNFDDTIINNSSFAPLRTTFYPFTVKIS